MIYREYGKPGLKVSILGLGGHEFYPGGRNKGFHIFSNFGERNREEIMIHDRFRERSTRSVIKKMGSKQ